MSKSEIINIDYIDHLKLNKNGTIEIRFSNDDFTYSSRRYLSIIKEALKL
ncbi:LytTR family DNA-binding domain-containing protein [Staphylococcus equorum]|nr:LytTR family transcriptional regulator DNA-binding domain-containing protein [Staphylococcus equorum]